MSHHRLNRPRATQKRPIHIGPQVLTGHSAACCTLDGNATLDCDTGHATGPLVNSALRHPKSACKVNLFVVFEVGLEVHASIVVGLLTFVNGLTI